MAAHCFGCVFTVCVCVCLLLCVCATNPTTKHLNGSIGDILVFPCTGVDTMADSSQLTQGGSKVRRLVNQLSWERSVQNYESQNSLISEGILKYG